MELTLSLGIGANATNLFLFSVGRVTVGAPPILDESKGAVAYTDPIPQALVLTAIVIGFAITAFVVVLALVARRRLGSLRRRLHETAQWLAAPPGSIPDDRGHLAAHQRHGVLGPRHSRRPLRYRHSEVDPRVLAGPPPRLARPGVAARLFAAFAYDVLIANFKVAVLVLGPNARLRPAFPEIPLDIEDAFGISLLASMITLPPGTLSAHVRENDHVLVVHAFDVQNAGEEIELIKRRYEAPLREASGC